jgi:hypothetical protein
MIVSTKEAAQSLEERAAVLDVDLVTCSLSFRLRQLMAEDDTIVRRVKGHRIDPPPVEVNPEATPQGAPLQGTPLLMPITSLALLRSPSMVFPEGSGCQTAHVGGGRR